MSQSTCWHPAPTEPVFWTSSLLSRISSSVNTGCSWVTGRHIGAPVASRRRPSSTGASPPVRPAPAPSGPEARAAARSSCSRSRRRRAMQQLTRARVCWSGHSATSGAASSGTRGMGLSSRQCHRTSSTHSRHRATIWPIVCICVIAPAMWASSPPGGAPPISCDSRSALPAPRPPPPAPAHPAVGSKMSHATWDPNGEAGPSSALATRLSTVRPAATARRRRFPSAPDPPAAAQGTPSRLHASRLATVRAVARAASMRRRAAAEGAAPEGGAPRGATTVGGSARPAPPLRASARSRSQSQK